MAPTWRLLIDDGPGSGAWNMALDRAIQLTHAAGMAQPTLRLYTWERPTVTLGRFQRADALNSSACDSYGVEVVRRFTGGRGVLHDDELTYSMVAGLSDGVPRGVAASYRHLCQALVEAYRLLGVPATLTARPRGNASAAACYLHATHADLSVGVAKLSGSAQVWSGETVLQHGSFTRTRDLTRESAVFGLDDVASAQLEHSTATLADLIGDPPDTAKIAAAAVEGLRAAFGVEVLVSQPTADEMELADCLREQVILYEDGSMSLGRGIVKVEP